MEIYNHNFSFFFSFYYISPREMKNGKILIIFSVFFCSFKKKSFFAARLCIFVANVPIESNYNKRQKAIEYDSKK
jgi:hypothetical protein